jgi:hypothetical protein
VPQIGATGYSGFFTTFGKPITMVAPLQADFSTFITDRLGKGHTGAEALKIVNDGSIWAIAGVATKPAGPESPFPYGFAVHAD